MGPLAVRIYLTGRLDVELGGVRLPARSFPGRQGRRAFAYLACERARPVPRAELADAIWAEALPPAWESALSAVLSKLRAALAAPGLPSPATITSAVGCHQLELPADAWVDLGAAAQAIDQAETALRRQQPLQAFGPACVASAVTHRVFLPGEDGAWIERQRTRLRGLRIRALDCLSDVWLANGEGTLAIEAARETIELEPFRETGYQRLMHALAARGDRAEALRVYERCRRLLADELGVDPSPQTEAVFLELLG